jgi:MazG family protein
MGDRSFADLVALIDRLRGPEGCPWDRAQDHRSLRPYVLEEAHEVVQAIDGGDPGALADELGDLLLQVLLHAQIASETGVFTIDEVIDGLADKLVRRHPHVFSDAPGDLSSIRRTWDDVKRTENHDSSLLPPLLEARKLVERFDGVLPASASAEPEIRAGRRLLDAIAGVWKDGHDPQIALRKAVDDARVQEQQR